jgi:phosphoglycerate kinase
MGIPRSQLNAFDLSNQRVFLRADLNVPLEGDRVINDYRLTALLPTIDLIQKKGGRIILATHLGRPQKPSPTLSTKILVPWFVKKGYAVRFEPDLEKAVALSHNSSEIILLENLRFFSGEQTDDQAFAQQLFKLGDYYVNDAFALLHRRDSSITLLPRLFPAHKKTIGLLVEQELTNLARLREHPEQPFVVVCGGGKVHDKLPLLKAMLGKATTILVNPALVFTFLKAQGVTVGKSLIDPDSLASVTTLMNEAQTKGTRLVFPVDYQVALDSFEGALVDVDAAAIPQNGIGITIGPKTAALFAQEIQKAKTVFFNGLPGLWGRPATLEGAHAIFTAMAESEAFTVIGGGDSVAAVEKLGLADRIGYCSTGGGATLAYLANEKLPGLDALN